MLTAAALAVVLASASAAQEEGGSPLAFNVRPSGVEELGETLDQKLARRERGFRFICIGCVRVPGKVGSEAPFEPIRTLNAPQLDRALAQPSPETARDLPP